MKRWEKAAKLRQNEGKEGLACHISLVSPHFGHYLGTGAGGIIRLWQGLHREARLFHSLNKEFELCVRSFLLLQSQPRLSALLHALKKLLKPTLKSTQWLLKQTQWQTKPLKLSKALLPTLKLLPKALLPTSKLLLKKPLPTLKK